MYSVNVINEDHSLLLQTNFITTYLLLLYLLLQQDSVSGRFHQMICLLKASAHLMIDFEHHLQYFAKKTTSNKKVNSEGSRLYLNYSMKLIFSLPNIFVRLAIPFFT